ncbi:MAG: transcriptional regulator [Phycisphaerales bacterium]|nr:transcriptional regulator [Phycisphaerales bacterium]
MFFDSIVTNPGRLQILAALAVEQRQDFVELRRRTRLTDGNLSSHARRLQDAGMIEIDKTFRQGKPVTQFCLTTEGRQALEGHVRRLMSALSTRKIETHDQPIVAVARPAVAAPIRTAPSSPAPQPQQRILVPAAVDEWVD